MIRQWLQDLIDVLVEGSEKKGLEINKKTSFVLVLSKNATRNNVPHHDEGCFTGTGGSVWVRTPAVLNSRRKIGSGNYKTNRYRIQEDGTAVQSKRVTVLLLKSCVWSTLLLLWVTDHQQDYGDSPAGDGNVVTLRRMMKISCRDLLNKELLLRATTSQQLMLKAITK